MSEEIRSGTANQSINPYVGPRTFAEDEQRFFFGRAKEIRILEGQVLARRASLFFAPSGAGKSSLLYAGLIPALTTPQEVGRGPRKRAYQKMQVLPVLTVGSGAPIPPGQSITNIYMYHALLRLFPDADPTWLVDLTLADVLDLFVAKPDGAVRSTAPSSSLSALLIFDQFEELFTHHVQRWPEREDFFRQVTAALEAYPLLHILFTMREDYLAELTPYLILLPEQLYHRFRLERLRRDAALQAVIEPAHVANPSRRYATDVAEALVDNLGRTQHKSRRLETREHSAGTAANSNANEDDDLYLSEYIEPVHLQIVCRELWDKLPSDQAVIQMADMQAFGDVDQALTQFYESTITKVLAETRVNEQQLRSWFNEQLITPAQTRGLVYRGERETAGLPNAAVDLLSAAWLIRADRRGSDLWYELAHDRLVEPVWASNFTWFNTKLSMLQRQAALWVKENRAEGLLLRGAILRDAEQWAADHAHELNNDEREFLEKCRTARRAAEVERRMFVTVAILAFSAVTAAIFAFIFLDLARKNEVEAITERDRAQTNESLWWASQSLIQLDIDPVTSLTLATVALPAADSARPYVPEAQLALVQAVRSSLERRYLRVSTTPLTPRKVAMPRRQAPDALALVAGDAIRTLNLTMTELITIATEITPVDEIRWINDNSTFITYNNRGQVVRLWSNNAVIARHVFAEPVACLAVQPMGEQIAICSGATLWLWDGSDTPFALVTNTPFSQSLLDARWSPDGQWLAAWDGDNTLAIWEQATAQIILRRQQAHRAMLRDAAWIYDATDRPRLVTVDLDRQLIIWPTATTQTEQVFPMPSQIDGIMPVDEHRFLTWGVRDATRLWTTAGEETRYGEPADRVADLRIAPNRAEFLTLSDDSTARLWPLATTPNLTTTQVITKPLAHFRGHTKQILAVAWHPTGAYLATAASDGTAIVWDRTAGAALTLMRGHETLDSLFDRIDIFGLYWSDSRHLVTYSEDGTFRKWVAFDEWDQPIRCQRRPSQSWPVCINGTQIVPVTDEGSERVVAAQWVTPSTLGIIDSAGNVRLVTPATATVTSLLQPALPCGKASWHPRGPFILFYSNFISCNEPMPAQIYTITGTGYATTTAPVKYAAWVNEQLLIQQANDQLLLYNTPALTEVVAVATVTETVTSVALSDDAQLAVGFYNGEVVVWDLNNQELRQPIARHLPENPRATGFVESLTWHNENNELLILYNDTVTLWRIDEDVVRFSEDFANLTDAILAPATHWLAVADDRIISVYDVETHERLWVNNDAGNRVQGVRWVQGVPWSQQQDATVNGADEAAPARLLLLTWDGAGVTRLWDWETQRLIDLMPGAFGASGSANVAAISPNGQIIAVGMENSMVQFWRIWHREPEALYTTACGLITRSLTDSQLGEFSVPAERMAHCYAAVGHR